MIHARKVDVMNKKLKNGTPSGSSNGATGEKSGFFSISRFKTSLIENTPGEDLEGKKWWWYTILVSVAIILVYALPEEHKEYRFAVGGWFILIALHLIVWPFFTEKTSLIAKVTMTAFILFFTNAAIFPKTAVYEVERFNNWRKTFDDNYGKARVSEPAQQSAATPARYQPEKRLDVLWLVPGDDFKEIPISPGAKFNVECPPEAEALLYYRDAPRGKPYNCAEERVVANGVLDNLRIGFAIREIEDVNGNMVPVTMEKVRIRVITEL